jgi:AcrR family transcriptional regulator
VTALGGERERARLLDACVEVVGEVGYAAATVDAIVTRAGQEGDAFDRQFADKDELFLVAWEREHRQYIGPALAAFHAQDSWRESMRAIGLATLHWVQSSPLRARFVGEGRNGDEQVRERFEAMVNAVIDLVDLGRQELDDPDSLTRATAEGIGGAVYEQVTMELARGGVEDYSRLLPNLMFLIVRPYLGIEAATEELVREVA